MKLADTYAEIEGRQSPCKIRTYLDMLDTDNREWLEQALAGDRFATKTLAETLTRNRLPVSDSTLGRHRRGECSCSQ